MSEANQPPDVETLKWFHWVWGVMLLPMKVLWDRYTALGDNVGDMREDIATLKANSTATIETLNKIERRIGKIETNSARRRVNDG